jgi:hypothetical protein
MLRALAIAILAATFTGCGTLNEPGVEDRLLKLIDYTTPDNMGSEFYSDDHYDGPNPSTEILDELRPEPKSP